MSEFPGVITLKADISQLAWEIAKLRHKLSTWRLEWVREPHEAFRLRPTHCINRNCGIRLNMPGTIGTCSVVCRNAVDGWLMDVSTRTR